MEFRCVVLRFLIARANRLTSTGMVALFWLFDLNSETERVRKRQKSATIPVDVKRFGLAINTDQVFGTHRSLETLISILSNSLRRTLVARGSQSISCPVWKPMAKVGLAGCAARRAASAAASA